MDGFLEWLLDWLFNDWLADLISRRRTGRRRRQRRPSSVIVPYVVGLALHEAEEVLARADLRMKLSGRSRPIAENEATVTAQDPPNGSTVSPRTAVSVAVCLRC